MPRPFPNKQTSEMVFKTGSDSFDFTFQATTATETPT